MKRAFALLATPAVLTVAACVPPQVHGIVQRHECADVCVHWINHQPAWQYPADTEWVGPQSDYEFDRDNNGAELLP